MGATVLALVLLIGGLAYWRQNAQPEAAPAASSPAAVPAAPPPVAEVPEINKRPHPQAKLPPLRFPGYPMARSTQEVQAAYKFAAEHPEVLSYVPCFCGCEQSGHRGNEDCFVQSRDVNGDVLEWQDHGMECSICLDVCLKSAQMYASGASVREIREAVEKQFSPHATTHTPTPPAP